jgi:general secretion pathway protein L
LSDFAGGAVGFVEPGANSLIREPSADLLAQARGQIIEIVLPPTAVLERRLDLLPAESRPYVENVVRHQIESILPWRASDVLHSTSIDELHDGRINVMVRATSRSAIAPAIAAAAACAPRAILVVADGDTDGKAALSVPLGAEASDKVARLRDAARYAIVALAFFSVCVVGWTFFHWQALASESATLDRAIADRRGVLPRAANPQMGAGLGGLKLQRPVAVRVLEELSAALPDDTYVTEFHMEADRLRIAGVSARAAELVPILERSGHFRNAAFYAPTTRMVGRRTDQFYIEALIAPGTGQ